jgi:hypothetical protein
MEAVKTPFIPYLHNQNHKGSKGNRQAKDIQQSRHLKTTKKSIIHTIIV